MWRISVRFSALALVAVAAGMTGVSLVRAQEGKKESAKQPPKKAAQDTGKATQDTTKKTAPKPPTAGQTGKPAAKAFYAKYQQWKDMLKKLGDIQSRYNTAKDGAESEKIRKEWNETISQGEQLLPDLRAAAMKAYEESPNEDRQLTRLLVSLLADAIGQDQAKTALVVAEVLIKHDCPDRRVWDSAGFAAFSLHEFEKASKYFKEAKAANVITRANQGLFEECEKHIALWKKEQEIVKAQQTKNLPQVRLKTTQGEILIELFEDDAPDTVGNFINLVESSYYDGLKFHRVLPNFMAQTGCPNGDGTGGPGWNIYDECAPDKYPNYRRHFRGSLSMAKGSAPHTGGSQFFITFRPTFHLNGKHTVFGRVTKGLEVLEKLQRINPESPDPRIVPDKIIKAEVIRKRDHEYVVNKVK